MSWVAAAIAGTGIASSLINKKSAEKTAESVEKSAQTQAEGNLETARLQNLLNNPNMITPFGTQTYTMGPDGRPVLTQTLSPEEQAKLAAQNKLQMGGLDILGQNLPAIQRALSGEFGLPGSALTDYDPRYAPGGRVPTSLDFSKAPGMPTASPEVLQQVEDALYGQGAQYLDPQFQQRESDLASKLANQGITAGSEAYGRETGNLALERQKAYGDLRDRAIIGGQDAMAKLYQQALLGRQQGVGEATTQGQFGQQGIMNQAQIGSNQAGLANAGRQQNFNEMIQNRTLPINMFNSLLSQGQINTPQFNALQPTSIQPVNYIGAAGLAGQANAAAASANAGLWGQAIQGIGKLGQTYFPPTQTPAATTPFEFGYGS